ncbi:MAG TPA: antibiotic biosynthesis monooxygenase [Rhodanobacteraceae bacterium]|jgi:heme-degrading monooxygenase HmoA
MIATVWRFRVKPDAIAAFERGYGPHGDWARLFARAEGFAGTELLKLEGQPGLYLTIDRWRDTARFEQAKTQMAAEYAELDRRFEAYTLEESWLGLYAISE